MTRYTEEEMSGMRRGDLLNAYDDLATELAEAKDAARAGGDEARARLATAKADLDHFRTYWRTIDHLFNPDTRKLHPFFGTGAAAAATEES